MGRLLIFGYGSLISRESRERTAVTTPALPVTVQGYKRGWFHRDLREDRMAVSIVEDKHTTCNGILCEIQQNDLEAFDTRELGYERVVINNAQIHGTTLHSDDTVYTYITKAIELPNKQFPIVQNYVDILLTGCIELGHDFTEEFIATTEGWEYTWVNDRKNPIFPRGLKKPPVDEIDEALKNVSSHRTEHV